MELIEVILSKENLNRAYKKVVANKGASGVDGVTVEELGDYIRKNREKIVTSLRNRTYIPKPVRRVYIPKDNGKKRPLGIPTALDRTIQQAIAQPISDIYEEIFSDYSYGFRAGRSCHDAIRQALEYLNDGYEWVVDIDIEQFFDKVNHDKLIQILREQVNDSTTLNLIRKYLKAGVMENGLEKATITGVPQGGPLSVVCSNVYLDKLDKELEHRGLRFTRYADDVLIFTKSEMAANRVMNSISDWPRVQSRCVRSFRVSCFNLHLNTSVWIQIVSIPSSISLVVNLIWFVVASIRIHSRIGIVVLEGTAFSEMFTLLSKLIFWQMIFIMCITSFLG